jgi:hypothetical protein
VTDGRHAALASAAAVTVAMVAAVVGLGGLGYVAQKARGAVELTRDRAIPRLTPAYAQDDALGVPTFSVVLDNSRISGGRPARIHIEARGGFTGRVTLAASVTPRGPAVHLESGVMAWPYPVDTVHLSGGVRGVVYRFTMVATAVTGTLPWSRQAWVEGEFTR